jgi:membrane protease YdiL (CAAX protease family)
VAVNLLHEIGPAHAGLVLGPAVALLLVVLARRHGLSWDDLGMSRRFWAKGAVYAAVTVALVGGVYAVAALLPATRAAFLDVRYQLPARSALLTALVVIPLGTILLEEIAFRGVLFGLLRTHSGTAWASAVSSALFGLWHVLPSLGINSVNTAVGAVFGHGNGGRLLAVASAVTFTALAGVLMCELRRRSGSLLAAAGLHWATNGLGVLLATALWTWGAG